MNTIDQLENYIEKGGNLEEILKPISVKERKTFLPALSELYKMVSKYEEGSYTIRIYPEKYLRAQIAGLVCSDTMTQFRQNFEWWVAGPLLDDKIIEEVYPWHIPKWLHRTLNRPNNWRVRQTGNYRKLIKLMEAGYFEPEEQLIANLFVNSGPTKNPNSSRNGYEKYIYNFIKLKEVALQEHFWLIFEHPTNISTALWREWPVIIFDLMTQGLVSRKEVIRRSLLTCTKGFNKAQTSWFYKLLKNIKVTPEEHLEVQTELFTCLNSDFGSARKYALDHIKKIMKSDQFNRQAFMLSLIHI